MSSINKLLWFIFGTGFGVLLFTTINYFINNEIEERRERKRNSEKLIVEDETSVIFIIGLSVGALSFCIVSVCWVFFDFWK